MQALRLTQWKSEPELVEVDEPEPAPGQVVVRVAGAGACHSDLHLMHEFEDGLVPWGPPFTLGHENAGWVETIGAGVTRLEVGMPVAVYGPWGCGRCSRCRIGMENYCERQLELGAAGGGLGFDGGMARLMLVPQSRWLVPLGDLDPVAAAPLTDAGLTPYHAIKRSLHLLGAGSNVAVIGAGGGLGHMAVQIVRALSAATVIGVDQHQAGLDRATRAGAHHGVASGDDAAAHILELTKGKGVDLALDLVGNDATMALSAGITRQLGHMTIVGIGGGSFSIGFFTIPYEVSVATTYWGSIPELMEVLALAESGRIAAHVERYPLAEATRAYADMQAGTLDGRAVIIPA